MGHTVYYPDSDEYGLYTSELKYVDSV